LTILRSGGKARPSGKNILATTEEVQKLLDEFTGGTFSSGCFTRAPRSTLTALSLSKTAGQIEQKRRN